MINWAVISACIYVLMILLALCIIRLTRNRRKKKYVNHRATHTAATPQGSPDKDAALVIYEVAQNETAPSSITTAVWKEIGGVASHKTIETKEVPEVSLAKIAIPHEDLTVASANVPKKRAAHETHASRDCELRFTRPNPDELSVNKLFKNAYLRDTVFYCGDCGRSLMKCLTCGWLICEDCLDGVCNLCGNKLYLDSIRNDFSQDGYSRVILVPASDSYYDEMKDNRYDIEESETEDEGIIDYLHSEYEDAVRPLCDECGEFMTDSCETCGKYYCVDCANDASYDNMCNNCGEPLNKYYDYEPDIPYDGSRYTDNPYIAGYQSAFVTRVHECIGITKAPATETHQAQSLDAKIKKNGKKQRGPQSAVRKAASTNIKGTKSENIVKTAAKRSVSREQKNQSVDSDSGDIAVGEMSAFMEDRENVLNDYRFGKSPRKVSEPLAHDNDEVIIINSRWRIEQNKRKYASSFFSRRGLTFDEREWFKWDPKIHYRTYQKKRILKGYEILENNLFEKCIRYKTTLGRCDCPDFIKRAIPCKHMYCVAIIMDLGLPISYDDYKNYFYANIW